eukprot:1156874-Pelagomonas_calceolata.AAC.9
MSQCSPICHVTMLADLLPDPGARMRHSLNCLYSLGGCEHNCAAANGCRGSPPLVWSCCSELLPDPGAIRSPSTLIFCLTVCITHPALYVHSQLLPDPGADVGDILCLSGWIQGWYVGWRQEKYASSKG